MTQKMWTAVQYHSNGPASEAGDVLDSAQLERATLGDRRLAGEVLGLFAVQARDLVRAISTLQPDAPMLAHKLRGSAQGIGAWSVAEAAMKLEAAIASSGDARAAAIELGKRVDDACAAIAARTVED